MRYLLALLLLLLPLTVAHAQDPEEDKGRFLEFIENRLSTDNRIIRVQGIEGALSTRASIDLITVADREGVWLRLQGNVIDWSRSALLRGRLDIERLAAERIEVLRTPVPDPDATPNLEAGGFSIPDLPLSIEIDELEVGELFLGEPLFGEEATVNITGSVSLVDGGLTASLSAARLDGPGGVFVVTAAYEPEGEEVAVRLELDEPADGIVANLANIEGRPPVQLLVEGDGTLNDLTVDIGLTAGNEQLLDGAVRLDGTEEGRRILADLDGAFGPLLPASLRDFIGQSSTLDLTALQREGGGLTVENVAIESGEISLAGQLRTAADGFLELLDLNASIVPSDGVAELPGGASIRSAQVDVDYNTGGQRRWNADVNVAALDAGGVGVGDVAFRGNGVIENPNDPAQRAVTFTLDGDATDLSAQSEALAQALGETLRFDVSGIYRSEQPTRVESAVLTLSTVRAVLDGVLDGLAFEGRSEIDIASLEPFSALAGRDLSGALEFAADGRIAPVSGAFDLTLNGAAQGIATGIRTVDELIGDATLAGRLARDETGITAENFRVDGEELDLTATGTLGAEQADFAANLEIADLSAISERIAGSADVNARIKGAEGRFDLSATGTVPQGALDERDLRNAEFAFDGTLNDGDLDGRVVANARLDSQPVSLNTEIVTLGPIQQLSDLNFTAGEARLTGNVRRNANGTLDGTVSLDAANIETLGALALTDASGAADANIALQSTGDEQSIVVTGALRDIIVNAARVARADISATVSDAFGVPLVDGRANAEGVVAGGVTVNTLDASASGTSQVTDFEASARINGSATAEIAGSLSPLGTPETLANVAEDAGDEAVRPADGARAFRVGLDRLRVSDRGTALELSAPTSITVANNTVTLNDLLAQVGDGTLRASGTAGENLDLSLTLDAIGLDVANAVRPDLGLDGTVSGTATVVGAAADPTALFDLRANDVTALQLRAGDVDPIDLIVAGRYEGGQLSVPTLRADNGTGFEVEGNVSAAIGEGAAGSLMANLALTDLPLAIANGFRDGLDASGSASGIASIAGTIGAPNATFRLGVRDATAAPIRSAGVEPLALDASGSFAGQAVQLAELALTNPQGVSATAEGTIPLAGGALDLDVDLAEVPLSIGGVAAPDLGLTGTLRGTANIEGSLTQPRGSFDLEATDVSANALRDASISPLDASLEGTLTGDGIELDEARVTNDQGVAVSADGTLPLSTTAPIDARVSIDSLPLAILNAVRPALEASGFVEGRAQIEGTIADPRANFDITVTNAALAPLRDAGIGTLTAEADGSFAGRTLTLQSFEATDGGDLRVTAEGTVPIDGQGQIDITANVNDLPLAIGNVARPELELAGIADATLDIAGTIRQPEGTFDVRGRGISAAPLRQNGIAPLDVDANGSLDGSGVTLARAEVSNSQGVNATAFGRVPLSPDGQIDVSVELDEVPLDLANAARPELDLAGRVSGRADIAGTLQAPRGTFDLQGSGITAAPVRRAGIAPLDLSAVGELDATGVTLEAARLRNGQGIGITASGRVPLSQTGELDVDVTLDDVPLSVANVARPELDLGGRVSGSASVTGSLSAPRGTFDIAGRGITARPLRDNGVAPLDVDVAGSSDGQRVQLSQATARNGQGLSLSASGSLPVDGTGPLDIDVRLASLPLSLANAVRPSLRAGGIVTGSASVEGPISDPRVRFDLSGSGVTAAPLADNGVSPLGFSASGSFANQTVQLASATASNGQGLSVDASGRIPLSGGGLAVQIDASAPLSLANRVPGLADRGAILSGSARFSGSVAGRLSDPQITGLVSTQNASFTDPLTNARLEGIDLLASVDGNRVDFRAARARLASGGTVDISGGINLDGLVADLLIALDDARYTDGRLVVATVDGRLRVSGPLNRSPLIAGRIDVQRAVITVPETFGGVRDVLDVRHVRPPADVLATLARARVEEPTRGGVPVPRTRPSVPQLDIEVNAPNQIFIRGRGLDVEVGGSVRVRGPVNNVQPTGAFELRRGRLSILTQRITFDRGSVTLTGDLNPLLDFRATTRSGDVLVIIDVQGRANDLSITFSSEPGLPQDEVLARLIFDRGLDELSPLQIARLAAAAAELAGGGPSIFSGLRDATGLDDLDVTTDSEGNAAVRAGRYINDNIYLGVEAGAGGGHVTIDLDLTDDLKARATTGPDESTLGVFYEKDF